MNNIDIDALDYREKMNLAVRLIDESVAGYVMPVLADHEKLLAYMTTNRKTWNAYTKDALRKSTEQAVACLLTYEAPLRSLLIQDYNGYKDNILYSIDLLNEFKDRLGLSIPKKLIDKLNKVTKTFPLSSDIQEWNEADATTKGALGKLVRQRYDAFTKENIEKEKGN